MPIFKDKRKYQAGISSAPSAAKPSRERKKLSIIEHYVYSQSDEFIGVINLSQDDPSQLPDKIKISNHWYELKTPIRWHE